MEYLRCQTNYQCEYCKKVFLNETEAFNHENNYCGHPDSPNQKLFTKSRLKLQEECNHPLDRVLFVAPDIYNCARCGKEFLKMSVEP